MLALLLVDPKGIEPSTLRMRTVRSPRLSYAPISTIMLSLTYIIFSIDQIVKRCFLSCTEIIVGLQ